MPGDDLVGSNVVSVPSRSTSVPPTSNVEAPADLVPSLPNRSASVPPPTSVMRKPAVATGGARPGAYSESSGAAEMQWRQRIRNSFRIGRRQPSTRRQRRSQRRSQMAVPPELRTIQEPSAENSTRRGRRRSSILNVFGIGGGSNLVSAECELQEEDPANRDEMDEEEVKTIRRNLLLLLLCGLVVVGVVLGVVFGVSGDKGDNPSEVPSDDDGDILPSERAYALMADLEQFVDDPSTFEDLSSPQYQAVKWLADDDDAQIDGSDMARLEQRFILATFYYATNQPNRNEKWDDALNFLSGEHECEWHGTDLEKGVFCDDNDVVSTISIRKYTLMFRITFVLSQSHAYFFVSKPPD